MVFLSFFALTLHIYVVSPPNKKKPLHIYLTIPSCIILMGRWIILQLYRETYINKKLLKKKKKIKQIFHRKLQNNNNNNNNNNNQLDLLGWTLCTQVPT